MKIALLGCKGTTLDLLHAVISRRIAAVDLVLTLPESIAQKNNVAFFQGREIIDYCQKQAVGVHVVKSYSLRDDRDLEVFSEAKIDLLLVLGWERLIPHAILGTLGKFACGMHGSPYGLPKGRGRSPLNWSIITGHNRFVTYLFKYDPGVDAGQMIGFKVFDINPFDNIATLHMKNRIAMLQLLEMYLPLIADGTVSFWPQPPETPTYYPRRTPADSGIDWSQTTSEIYGLVRAVAPPYPPAYCYANGTPLYILQAHPFDTALFHNSVKPGTIVDLSLALGQFVVATRDGTLLVERFSGVSIAQLQVGDLLGGVDAREARQRISAAYPEDLPDYAKEI